MNDRILLPRRALAAATLAAAAALPARRARAQAQAWPQRPVRLLVGFPPGGSTDVVARLVAQGLAAAWGQSVVVDNRSGANATIANEAVARAAPDGYTLLLSANNLVTNPPLFRQLPYDPERDLTAIHTVAVSPNVAACGSAQPWRTLAELVAAAKARPGQIGYSTSGIGSNGHYGGALLNLAAGIDLPHIPYRGAAPATQDTISGAVPLTINTLGSLIGPIRGGQLRALAVAGPARTPDLPDTPTFAEAGYDVADTGVWYGVMGPAGLPPDLLRRIEGDVAALLRQDEMREKLLSQGAPPLSLGAAAFAARIHEELPRWRAVAQAAGIRPE
ncbi:MAG TPA: tripartite tricarboxylate transporter substrate binding protein [Roseomonas sp.]|jgi:tripartite-type tricarboxylate transporter receptor subunit TctC